MSDFICKKTMRPCAVPSMCSPYGGCSDWHDPHATRTISEDEVRRIAREEIERFFAAKESK